MSQFRTTYGRKHKKTYGQTDGQKDRSYGTLLTMPPDDDLLHLSRLSHLGPKIGLIYMVSYCSLHRSWALDSFFGSCACGGEEGEGNLVQVHLTNAKCPMTP